jgi:hypothetical protein
MQFLLQKNQLLYWFCFSIDTYRAINKRNRPSLKKLTVSQLFNKFSTFYWSRNSLPNSLPTASFDILLEINTGDSLLFKDSKTYKYLFFSNYISVFQVVCFPEIFLQKACIYTFPYVLYVVSTHPQYIYRNKFCGRAKFKQLVTFAISSSSALLQYYHVFKMKL